MISIDTKTIIARIDTTHIPFVITVPAQIFENLYTKQTFISHLDVTYLQLPDDPPP